MTLTQAEYDVVDKIAHKSKMDCWFMVYSDEDGNDYVKDLERGETITIREGVCQLLDGMTCYADYNMTKKEVLVFEGLTRKLNLSTPSYLYENFTES